MTLDVVTFDAYLDGSLLAQDLQPATVADLCKLEFVDVAWAIEEHGCCSLRDDSGRELALVAHGDHLRQEHEDDHQQRLA
jgi:hypothetical protein